MVWITKRIPWTPGQPTFVAIYYCSGPRCAVSTDGKMKGASAAGVRPRPAASAARLKPKGKKKPKLVVVGRGKTKVPGGETRKVKLRLNKIGAAVLKKRGKATIQVTLTVKIAGQAKKEVQKHTIHVYLKKAKKPKR